MVVLNYEVPYFFIIFVKNPRLVCLVAVVSVVYLRIRWIFFLIFAITQRMVCLVAVVSVVYIRITQYSRTEEGLVLPDLV